MSYIDLPITSDAYSLAQQAKGVLTTNGWTPSDGDPEVVVIESLAPSAQNAAEVAAQVPSSIFRKFGTDLVGLPYLNGAPAEGTVTFTIADSAGITVPANTFVQIGDLFFATIEEAVVPAGSSSVSGVSVRAIEDGTAGNALTGPVQLVDSLARVNVVTLVGTTTGGADAEDDDAYMSRLRATLQLMAPRPITADDYAVLAKSTPDVGVGRSTAIDGYNPANSTSNNPRMVYVVTTDVDGLALSSGDKAAIEDFLEPHREVNFVVNVADATYNRVGIAYSYKAYPGFDTTGLTAAINAALAAYLSPATWGLPTFGDDAAWTNQTIVRINKLIGLIENVSGVDYVTTVLINGVAADLTMTGPVPLPAISADTSKTGNTTNANATVAIADTTGLYPNMYASGSGIPTGTTISSVGGSSITLSANAAATATGVSLSFTAIRATVL